MNQLEEYVVGTLDSLNYLVGDTSKLGPNSKKVKDALAKYQETWAPDMVEDSKKHHGRPIVPNGELGPVTLGHMQGRSCGCPDFAEDGLEIAEANWPSSCRHDIKIRLDLRRYSSSRMGLSSETFRQQYVRALNDWNKEVDLKLSLVPRADQARVYVTLDALSGSTLAWSHLANNSCGRKEQRYDIRRWSAHMLYLTVLHEVGHLIGLPHRTGNFIMNPSIITSLRGLTTTDIQRARNLGYGAPDRPDPDPDPTGPNLSMEIVTKDGERLSVTDLESLSLAIK